MDRIESVRVKDVGPFLELEMEFPEKPVGSKKAELHILTGENGTGKTTLLFLLTGPFSPKYRKRINERKRTARTRKADWTISIAGKDYIDNHVIPFVHSRALDAFNSPTVGWRPEWRCSWSAFGYSGSRHVFARQVDAIKDLEQSPFAEALSFSHGDFGQIIQWVANAKSKSALHAQSGDELKAAQVTEAIRQIENAVSEITGKKIEFILHIEPIAVRLRIGGDELDFDVLPEGLKSILSWLGDLLMRLDRIPWEGDVPLLERPFYLFLDEIDVHLHPAWQRKVLPAVQALFPNAQMFVTTHSPFVVNSVSEGTVHRLALNDDGTARFDKRFEARSGQSVELILDEVFGVSERFDVETEKKIDELRRRREEVLSSDGTRSMDEWRQLIRELSGLGEETSAIASFEARQVERLLAKKSGGPNGRESHA
jgi:predicted ATP-binding protein involved in virulence